MSDQRIKTYLLDRDRLFIALSSLDHQVMRDPQFLADEEQRIKNEGDLKSIQHNIDSLECSLAKRFKKYGHLSFLSTCLDNLNNSDDERLARYQSLVYPSESIFYLADFYRNSNLLLKRALNNIIDITDAQFETIEIEQRLEQISKRQLNSRSIRELEAKRINIRLQIEHLNNKILEENEKTKSKGIHIPSPFPRFLETRTMDLLLFKEPFLYTPCELLLICASIGLSLNPENLTDFRCPTTPDLNLCKCQMLNDVFNILHIKHPELPRGININAPLLHNYILAGYEWLGPMISGSGRVGHSALMPLIIDACEGRRYEDRALALRDDFKWTSCVY